MNNIKELMNYDDRLQKLYNYNDTFKSVVDSCGDDFSERDVLIEALCLMHEEIIEKNQNE